MGYRWDTRSSVTSVGSVLQDLLLKMSITSADIDEYQPKLATTNTGYGYNTHSQEFYADIYPSCFEASAGPRCMGYCLPCIAAGKVTRVAGSLGGGNIGFCLGCLFYGVCFGCLIHGCLTAQALRRKFPTGVEESVWYTCLSHLGVPCCALARELQYIENLREKIDDFDWLFRYWDKANYRRTTSDTSENTD